MNLDNMSKEELELLSYTDIAYKFLIQNDQPMNTPSIFRKICDLLLLTEDDYTMKIGDFYTSLTTDKRFILLDTGEWDVTDHHSVKLVLEEDDEEDDEIAEDDEEEIDEEIVDDADMDTEVIDDDLDDVDDDMDELNIMEDDEIEEE